MTPALALALVVAAPALVDNASLPVRALARPDIPWLVAVVAVDAAALDHARCVDAKQPVVAALVDAGGSAAVDGALVVVEGPPDAEAAILAAARACTAHGAIFLEGRTSAHDSAVLPPRSAPPSRAVPAAAHHGLALAPAPGLLDVEGAALALFVDDALPPGLRARVAVDNGAASLVIDVVDAAAAGASGTDKSAVRTALTTAVATPLAPKLVDALRTRAQGVVAERRSRVGGWARDMAAMWLAFGTVDVDDCGDLGVRVRARVFPDVLVR